MRLTGVTIMLLASCVLTGTVRAQSPDIISFHGNGQLTWTNSDTNLFYQVQWAASLVGSSVWQSSYATLSDIQSTNPTITTSVPMFYRVAATSNRVFFAAPLPKTGQTTTYQMGDDAWWGTNNVGVAWPSPRFTVGTGTSSNCVTDKLTGLMWLRNPDATARDWTTAITYCKGLDGTNGRGNHTDWRLPNLKELQSLIDLGYRNPALCDTTGTGQWLENDPFIDVQPDYYWSSTTVAGYPDNAWWVHLLAGSDGGVSKATTYYVWPVRGGQ